MAALAVEFWKILKAFDRAISLAPDSAKRGLSAQARYAHEKLASLTEAQGFRLVSFDGIPFEVNLPAVAVNAQDVTGAAKVMIERTLEPAVVANGTVLATGRVFVVAEGKQEEK